LGITHANLHAVDVIHQLSHLLLVYVENLTFRK